MALPDEVDEAIYRYRIAAEARGSLVARTGSGDDRRNAHDRRQELDAAIERAIAEAVQPWRTLVEEAYEIGSRYLNVGKEPINEDSAAWIKKAKAMLNKDKSPPTA